MVKMSWAGFFDWAREPRRIIWMSSIALVMILGVVVALGVTSTRWYCSNGCHQVQDDTILAYDRSAHAHVPCLSCHMPVNSSPIVFMIHKLEALGQLALTVTNEFELPLNKDDEVSLTMDPTQCTQCHKVLTRPGDKSSHQVHSDRGITCTICHNRAAHKEDFTPTLIDPRGEANETHPDFAAMVACFRCHGREPGSPAPGTCTTCHSATYHARPASHGKSDFLLSRHGALAKMAITNLATTLKQTGEPTATPQRKAKSLKPDPSSKKMLGQRLVPVGAVYYCGMCHDDKFCDDCHGLHVPHTAQFKSPADPKDPLGHPAISAQSSATCVPCHLRVNSNFCVSCHHGRAVGHVLDPTKPWLKVHPLVALPGTLGRCYRAPLGIGCHDTKTCTDCHFENLWKRRR
jgi:hypothetical protein